MKPTAPGSGAAGRMTIAVVLLAATGILPLSVRSQVQDTLTLTLPSARELFLRENLPALAARYHLAASEAAVVSAGLLPNPQFSFNASYIDLSRRPVDYGSTQTSYRVDQLVELWGKRGKRIAAAEHEVASAREDFQNTLFQLLADLKESVIGASFAQRNVELADGRYRIFQQAVDAARLRFRAGDIGEEELRKLELAQLDYQEDLSDAEQSLTEALSTLKHMLNLQPSAQVRVSREAGPGGPPPPLDTLSAHALRDRPDVIAQHEQTLMRESRLAYARSGALPDITLGVELDRQGPAFRTTFGGGVGVAIPLFARNQDEIERSEAEYQAALVEERAKRNGVLNDVAAAYGNYLNSWNIVRGFSSTTLGHAEEVRAMAVKSYTSGNIGLVDFLETERIYYDALQSYTKALSRLAVNGVELERATGSELFREVSR